MQELPLNGFYSGESKKLSDRQCINFVPTISDSGASSSFSLMPSSGVDYTFGSGTFWDSDYITGNITGQVYTFENNNISSPNIFIVGRKLIGTDGTSIVIKSLPATPTGGGTTTALCENSRICSNPDTALIVAPSYSNGNRDRAYIADKSLNLTSIDLVTALGSQNTGLIDCEYFGGRFLFLCNQDGYDAVYYTSIGGTSPNSLDFFAPDTVSEKLQGLKVINNTLYLFAKTKCYLYQVTANTDIPFQQIGAIDVGISSPHSKAELDGGVAIYGKNKNGQPSVYIVSGGGIKKVSTKDVDYNLNSSESIRLFTFSDKSRKYLAVRGDNSCFVFDAESGIWHERKSLGSQTWEFVGYGIGGEDGCLIGSSFENVGGRLFTRFGPLNRDIGTELKADFPSESFSGLVERKVITSPFNASNDRMIVHELEPVCEVDMSNFDSGWPEPKINLSISYDFGNTFEIERDSRIGRAGNYKQRTRFFNIGYVEQAFTVMLRTLNPYPVRVIKLLARTMKGGS